VISIVSYDARWLRRFAALGDRLRGALGDLALRIDHIGSTAVPGFAAKPVIDIQISVAALEPAGPFREPIEKLGYVYRPGNTERTKRYFREPPGAPRTHLHVRRAGSFSEQFPLLFRDYLRTIRMTRQDTRTSSGAWPRGSRTMARPTPTRRCRSSGKSSAARTNGPSRPGGSRDPATREPGKQVAGAAPGGGVAAAAEPEPEARLGRPGCSCRALTAWVTRSCGCPAADVRAPGPAASAVPVEAGTGRTRQGRRATAAAAPPR